MQLGDSYQWNTRTVAAAPVVAAPVVAGQRTVFNVGMFKCFGAILALLAAATLSLGIADVVLTMQAYCTPWNTAKPVWCSTTAEPYIWTWVASGIWGSIPIFLAGIFAMCLGSNPREWTRCFALLIFLSAIVFAPAMIVLSAIEIWRGGAAQYMFYSMGSGSMMPGNILPASNPYQAKFAIPLVIAILAGIMFLMTGVVTLNLCCCMNNIGIYLDQEVVSAPAVIQAPAPPRIVTNQVYYPPRPQIRQNFGQINYQGGDDDDDFEPYGRYPGFMPTRYNGVANAFGSSAMYGNFGGNFAPRASNSFASDFFKPNPSYFWK